MRTWRLLSVSLLLLAASCGQGETVAGATSLDESSREIQFRVLAPVKGPGYGLGFEFETPDESAAAETFDVALVDATQNRRVKLQYEADRVGERTVVLRAVGDARGVAGKSFRAAFVSSPMPVRVREIRWFAGEE